MGVISVPISICIFNFIKNNTKILSYKKLETKQLENIKIDQLSDWDDRFKERLNQMDHK